MAVARTCERRRGAVSGPDVPGRSTPGHPGQGDPARLPPSERDMRRALITGITGQDGLHLAEHLVEQGYLVFGLLRGQHNPKRVIVEREVPDVTLVEGDLTDQGSLINAVQRAQPDEVYNLGAMSFVSLSWTQPELTANVTG